IRSSTDAGAEDAAAPEREAVQVALKTSICCSPCSSWVASRVRMPFPATSRDRIICQDSARLASAFGDGDDASASVVPASRWRTQSLAEGSLFSICPTPGPAAELDLIVGPFHLQLAAPPGGVGQGRGPFPHEACSSMAVSISQQDTGSSADLTGKPMSLI